MFAFKSIVRLIDAISVKVGQFVSFFILIVIGTAFVEIVSRYFFNRPTTWSYELGQMLFGTYFSWCLCHAISRAYRNGYFY